MPQQQSRLLPIDPHSQPIFRSQVILHHCRWLSTIGLVFTLASTVVLAPETAIGRMVLLERPAASQLPAFLSAVRLVFNYQIGEYVFGIEGDGDWTNLHGNSGSTCGAISAVVIPPVSCQTQSQWLATVRGRVGYAFDRILLYGTAGAAFGNIQTGLNPPSTFDSSVEAGWTVGAGLEYAFAQNWTAKVEYLFVDLPNGSCTTVGNCGGAAGSIVSFNENIFRAGINFKFGPW